MTEYSGIYKICGKENTATFSLGLFHKNRDFIQDNISEYIIHIDSFLKWTKKTAKANI